MNIIDRIQKLLRLAQNAGSEQEAALAAERASQLMAQHEIHEAMLNLDAPTETRAVEEIVKHHDVTTTRKKVAWHMRIVNGVAATYGAYAYWQGPRVVLFGRLSAVQAAAYTSQFLIREVERICDANAPRARFSRGYRNAFRLGCAARIEARLQAVADMERGKMQRRVRHEARGAGADHENFDVSDVAGNENASDEIPTPPASAGVIARVERDREEVKQAYTDYSKKWRSARVGQVSSGSGYKAGRAAGDRAKLPGRTRGGLPRGQDSLP